MFGGEASDKKVKVLSGGERSRLAMIRLLLEPVNLLILDEPTNHLDMKSKDVLKDAIKDFNGTVIVVSHDREFLDGLVDKVYEFGNQRVKEHLYGIYEFLEKKKMESLRELEIKIPAAKTVDQKREIATPEPDNKLTYEERKEKSRIIKKIEKQISETESNIASKEEEIARLEKLMAMPENGADTSLYTKHGILKKELEQEMERWENLSLELEDIQNGI